MEEHKVLTGMLLVALVVSVVGTVVTVDRLGSLNSISGGALTGAASGTGELNITTDVTITLIDSSIDFGSGQVDSSASHAVLDSELGAVTAGSWANGTDFIVIRNDGNYGANITVQSNRQAGNHSSISFICQNDVGGCGGPGYPVAATQFKFESFNGEAGSCVGLAPATDFESAETNYDFCNCLKPGDNNDEAKLSLTIGVPNNADGQKQATFTFTSSQAQNGC